jgi:hypothetical protein
MKEQDQLTESVRVSLQTKADTVQVADDSFDPTQPGLTTGTLPDIPAWRTRKVTLVLASVAAILVVVGVTVAVVAERRSHNPTTVDSTATTPDSASPWVRMSGPETPAPPVPAGWQVMDYGDFRFALPSTWTAPIGDGCWPAGNPPAGVVIARPAGGLASPFCTPKQPLPESSLTIEGGHGPPPSAPRTSVGALTAVGNTLKCIGCSPAYHFDNGYVVAATGPDAAAVLATFTDSGRVTAMKDGPVANTAAWHKISFQGVAFKVPGDWSVVDLPGSYTETTDGGGTVNGFGGQLNPGACGSGGLFYVEEPPRVYTGSSPIVPSCPAPSDYNLAPANGIWAREPVKDENTPDTSVVTNTQVGANKVVVEYPSPHTPAVTVVVTTPTGAVEVTVGVGADPSTTRTILGTISRA